MLLENPYEVMVNVQCAKCGSTPLLLAVQKNDMQLAEALLKAGADATIGNKKGLNAIEAAKTLDNPFMTSLLKKHTGLEGIEDDTRLNINF